MVNKKRCYFILAGINVFILLITVLIQYKVTQPDIILNDIMRYIEQETDDEGQVINKINIDVGDMQPGVYEFSILYETDRSDVYLYMKSIEMGKSAIQVDDFLLNPNKKLLTTQLWIDTPTDNLTISISYEDSPQKGMFTAHNIVIERNTLGSGTYSALKILTVLLIIDALAWLFLEKEKVRKNRGILLGLVCIIIVSSLGLLAEGWKRKDDTVFHMARIWGLANGIHDGTFPVKVQPEWTNEYGFAVSVFYGDLFLYFPAILVLLKTPLYVAYKVYIWLINIGTTIISFRSFSQLAKSRKIGLLCSAMYTLSIYRLCDIYYRDAVGEYTAMMFIPLIIAGMWNILFEDVKEVRYKGGWIQLSIGMACVIQSHILSCEMIVLFLSLVSILEIRNIFKERRFIELIKAVVGTVCLSAAFIVPFLDYAREDLNVFIERPFYRIQWFGVSLSELLRIWGVGGGVSQYSEVTAMAVSIGLPAALIIILCLYLLPTQAIENKKNVMAAVLVLSFLSIWMSTDIFPYNYLEEIPGMRRLVGSLQFPFRFMSIAVGLLTLMTCITMAQYKKKADKTVFAGIVLGLCIISACQGMQYIQHTESLKDQGFAKCAGDEWSGGCDTLSGGQYLYRNTDYKAITNKKQEIRGNVKVADHTRKGLEYIITCSAEEDTKMKLPLLYYPDYQCWDVNQKTQLQTMKGDNNELWVEIPGGYDGTLKVFFVEPLSWRMSEILSLLAVVFYAVWIRRAEKNQCKSIIIA